MVTPNSGLDALNESMTNPRATPEERRRVAAENTSNLFLNRLPDDLKERIQRRRVRTA
jgi:hypothetical protein